MRQIPPHVLLDRFVEYDRETRRDREHAITRTGFASFLDLPDARTLRLYHNDYNFPFPPVSPGELVLLLDNAPPHELLWVSDAWCEVCGRQREQIIYRPASYLRELSFADGPRDMHRALARQLRANPSEVATTEGWLRNAAGERVPIELEMRYGRRSDAFYVRATLLELTDAHDAEVFDILKQKPADLVELMDLERLYREALPVYRYQGPDA
jgi:hypothetical protein